MNLEICKTYVDELKKIGVKNIVLIGGEPTIYPYFLELIDYININKMNVILATNGDKFSDYSFAKKAVDKGLNNVNISLKYTDVDNYRLLSDNSDINNIINGHNNLRSLGCSVTMSYVILNQTIEDINKLKKFLIQNSINKIFFQLYKPTTGDKQVTHSCQELAIKCKEFYDIFKDSNINFAFDISIPMCLFEKIF